MGLIPGTGRSPAEVNGYLLQYSCLENSMDRGAWWAIKSMGSQRVGHDWITFLTFLYIRDNSWKLTGVTLPQSLPLPSPSGSYSLPPHGIFLPRLFLWRLTFEHLRCLLKSLAPLLITPATRSPTPVPSTWETTSNTPGLSFFQYLGIVVSGSSHPDLGSQLAVVGIAGLHPQPPEDRRGSKLQVNL